jgi:CHAD domain-containing protein
MNTSQVRHVYDLPDGIRSQKVIGKISEHFNAVFPSSRRLRHRYYDTFDWRLYGRGLSLVRVDEEYRLRRVDDDATVGSCRISGDPSFWRDFPEGRLRDSLRQMLDERALLMMGEIGLRIRDIRVLNSDRKTVVRACVEEGGATGSGDDTAMVRVVNVLPVRGYDKDARRLVRFLVDSGLQATARSTFDVAVEMQGRKPGDYTSKLQLQLDRSMTAQEASGVVLIRLLDTMERNEDGIRRDIDTEFLHDFRVAVRRTRSFLSQAKNILPAGITDSFLEKFAELGRSTNRLRDLDVYLLNRHEYQQMLAEDLRPSLSPLFDALAKERNVAHAVAVRTLDGRQYRKLIQGWRETLEAIGSQGLDAKNASVPVAKLSRRLIVKRYARVIEKGGVIDDVAPDAALHALRIDCKKLRYLLEFFASLYQPDEVGVFVKQLKRLQDNLGDFNDLSVQREEMKSFLHNSRRPIPVETAAAVGALVARLEDRQKRVRKNFAETFATFAGRDNADRFDRLFEKS